MNIVTVLDDRIYYHTGHPEADESKDTMEIMISLLVMVRAREESVNKSRMIAESWEAKKKKGKAYTTVCPSWMQKDGDKYKLIPIRAKTVKHILNLYKEGYGDRAISTKLNESNTPRFTSVNQLKNLKKKPYWSSHHVNEIRRSRALYGVYQPKRIIDNKYIYSDDVEEFYPPIITKDEYLELRAIAARKVKVKTGGVTSIKNVLRGVATCGSCGLNLILKDCGSRKRNGKMEHYRYLICTCKKMSIDFDTGVKFGLDSLYQIDQVKIINEKEGEREVRESERLIAEGQIAEIREKIEVIMSFIAANPSDSLMLQVVNLESEAQKIKDKIGKVDKESVIAPPKDVGTDLDNAESRKKLNQYLLSVYKKLVIHQISKCEYVFEMELDMKRGRAWIHISRKSIHRKWQTLSMYEDAILTGAFIDQRKPLPFPRDLEALQELMKYFREGKKIQGVSSMHERLKQMVESYNDLSGDVKHHGTVYR